MRDYIYQNTLINKKQLKELLAWSFTKYDSMQASLLEDELKYLGFKYATQAGITLTPEALNRFECYLCNTMEQLSMRY